MLMFKIVARPSRSGGVHCILQGQIGGGGGFRGSGPQKRFCLFPMQIAPSKSLDLPPPPPKKIPLDLDLPMCNYY